MGVLPLMFMPGENAENLGLDGSETYFISGIADIQPRQQLEVRAVKPDNREIKFNVIARLDTDIEVDYYHGGGILPYVLRKIMQPE
jgi:aconitate hydratase